MFLFPPKTFVWDLFYAPATSALSSQCTYGRRLILLKLPLFLSHSSQNILCFDTRYRKFKIPKLIIVLLMIQSCNLRADRINNDEFLRILFVTVAEQSMRQQLLLARAAISVPLSGNKTMFHSSIFFLIQNNSAEVLTVLRTDIRRKALAISIIVSVYLLYKLVLPNRVPGKLPRNVSLCCQQTFHNMQKFHAQSSIQLCQHWASHCLVFFRSNSWSRRIFNGLQETIPFLALKLRA